MAPNLTMFCALFRTSLASSVEYSVSDDMDMFGTMVAGDGDVLDRVRAFVVGTPFESDWYSGCARLFRSVRPSASLFRVDWLAESPFATTLYMKFVQAPTDSELGELLAFARSFHWCGASPVAVGEVLGLAGPTGIALRSTALGARQVALYYRLETARILLSADVMSTLLRTAEISYSAERILTDSVTLARTCPLSVIGIDGGLSESGGALKLDWSEVPPHFAKAIVASKGASHRAIARLDELSNALRTRWLSYLSMKYSATGFSGWRAYFSVEPHRYIPVSRPSLRTTDGSRGSKMPHY